MSATQNCKGCGKFITQHDCDHKPEESKPRPTVQPEPEQPNNMPVYIVGGGALVALAIVYWQLTLVVGFVGGAGYALYKVRPSVPAAPVSEPVEAEDAPKQKRSYTRRIKVNHYQLGKVAV